MLKDEDKDELLDRLEAIIYVLGERMPYRDLEDVVRMTVEDALDDVRLEHCS